MKTHYHLCITDCLQKHAELFLKVRVNVDNLNFPSVSLEITQIRILTSIEYTVSKSYTLHIMSYYDLK